MILKYIHVPALVILPHTTVAIKAGGLVYGWASLLFIFPDISLFVYHWDLISFYIAFRFLIQCLTRDFNISTKCSFFKR